MARKKEKIKEPQVHGAKPDVSSGAMPRLTAALLRTQTVDMQRLVHSAGPALSNHQAVGRVLGLQFDRLAEKLFQLWREKLSQRERSLLRQLESGIEPDALSLQQSSGLDLRKKAWRTPLCLGPMNKKSL